MCLISELKSIESIFYIESLTHISYLQHIGINSFLKTRSIKIIS